MVVAGPRRPRGREEGRTAGAATHATRMAAEQAFQKGMALLRETKTASAAIELRRASELQPDSLEYLLYATWARARSYREIPSESEQRTLLEIAQRAKRRDPMFAFGSYVIGQISMWAGDDATAKKWFYEALRLDPTSEAGKQVRILARRGPGTATPPGAEEPAELAKPSEPAAVSAGEPPAGATAGPEPSEAPSSRPTNRLLAGAALLATGALVVLAVARSSLPGAKPAPGASPQPALSVDAAPPVDADHRDASVPPDGTAEKPPEATRREGLGRSEYERSGGRCCFLRAPPGIGSSWMATASRLMGATTLCIFAAARTWSRSEAAGRPTPSSSPAAERFSYNEQPRGCLLRASRTESIARLSSCARCRRSATPISSRR